jgi:hypothetical protein
MFNHWALPRRIVTVVMARVVVMCSATERSVSLKIVFCVLLLMLLYDRPDLSSERVPHRDNTATFRRNITSGHKFQNGLDTKTY